MSVSLSEFVLYSTVQINCTRKDGKISPGTGFFFQFSMAGSFTSTVIVTNKHVIKDSQNAFIVFTLEGSVNGNKTIRIDFAEFEKMWIHHPDKDVDLCIMPTSNLFETIKQRGFEPQFAPYRMKEIPNFTSIELYKPIEEILLVGYPIGLSDVVNNLPLVRRGITATPFYISYNGKKEFLIDCACFPGSSGSPIIIMNEGSFSWHKQPLQSGNRMLLLGILYSGPTHEFISKIKSKEMVLDDYLALDLPINLGFCISSERLLDFLSIIEEQAKR